MDNYASLPRVSIVTPSFNQAEFIEETILSVQGQNYPNLEHIIVDGGSTDGTLSILKKYGDKIKWISEKDSGQANAINKGFKMAEGEIIGWLNSDDPYLEGAVSSVVNVFLNHSKVQVLYGDYVFLDGSGRRIYEMRLIHYDLYILLFDRCYIAQPAVFYKKEIFNEVGFLDETLKYAMDWEYFLRLGFSGYHFYHIPKLLAGYRLHKNSKTMSELFGCKEVTDEENKVRQIYIKRCGYSTLSDLNLKILRKYHRIRRRVIQLLTQNIVESPHLDRMIKESV